MFPGSAPGIKHQCAGPAGVGLCMQPYVAHNAAAALQELLVALEAFERWVAGKVGTCLTCQDREQVSKEL
eukprot:1161606-Pelagomonas_calceolata.AAC.19